MGLLQPGIWTVPGSNGKENFIPRIKSIRYVHTCYLSNHGSFDTSSNLFYFSVFQALCPISICCWDWVFSNSPSSAANSWRNIGSWCGRSSIGPAPAPGSDIPPGVCRRRRENIAGHREALRKLKASRKGAGKGEKGDKAEEE